MYENKASTRPGMALALLLGKESSYRVTRCIPFSSSILLEKHCWNSSILANIVSCLYAILFIDPSYSQTL